MRIEKREGESYAPERIINKLREVEVLLCQSLKTCEAARKIGSTE